MPIFEIEHAGKSYEVDAPDETSAVSALTGPSAPKAAPVDPAIDALKSTGVGVAKGVLGLADIPRMIESGLNAGNEYLVSKGIAKPRDRTPVMPMPPSSQELQAKIEETTGKFYEPKTAAGEWGEYIGGFAPGIIGGPGGLVTRAGTQVLAPALASEGAGQLAKDSKYETLARVAGAILGGPAASRAVARVGAAPTTEALKDASTSVFRDAGVRGTAIPQADIRATGNSLIMRLDDAGFNTIDQPAVFRHVARLDSASTVGEIHNVRKALNKVEQGSVVSNPAQAEAARVAKGEMDRLLDTVSPQIRGANQNYGAGKRGEKIAEALEKADNNAGAANSGQNIDNATRQQLKAILNSKKERRGFSQDELAQMKTVATGTRVGNSARYIGNLLGGGGGLGQMTTATLLGGGGGYAAGGAEGAGTGALLAIALGRGFKGVENASTRRQAAKLSQMVRSRSPLGQSQLQTTGGQTVSEVARALMRAQAANDRPR